MGEILPVLGGSLQGSDVGPSSCLSLLMGAGGGMWESIPGREQKSGGIFAGNNVHLAPLPPGLAGGSSSAAAGQWQSVVALGAQLGQMAWRSPKASSLRGGERRR